MSDWKKVKIGEIFKIEKGSLQSSKCIPGKYDFITAATDWKTHESYSHDCEAIVYAVAASGSLGRAHYVNGKFIASDLCFILTEKDKEKYPINFQFYQLTFELIREEIVSKTKTGTSKESINQKNFSNYEIPYFSFDYQMANYEKLVNTKQKISELLEESEKQKSYVKHLRQNILQDAIEGKLTEEWRKNNPVIKGNPDFDAEALFEKIQEEKNHTSDSELLRNSKKKEKSLPEITEDEKPFEIPEGWKWVRLGEISKIVRGGSPRPAGDKTYYDGKIPFLKVADITNSDEKELWTYTYTIKETGLKKTRYVEKETLMLTNSGATLGIPKICMIATTFNDGIAAFLDIKNRITKDYLYYFLKSKTKWFLKEAAKGQGQPNLNTDIIAITIFALPPLAEQKEIVSRVEKLLANVTELEKQITEREEMTKQLMQSIMKDAFREE